MSRNSTIALLCSLVAGALFVVYACSSDDGDAGCPAPCPAGQVCDPATKTCVPEQSGACVPPCSGANIICTAAQTCDCATGYADCNGDKQSGASGDGCECAGSCDGTSCEGGTTPTGCKPSVVNDCGEATKYCDTSGQCVPCPGGMFNCDGVNECEDDVECGSTGCDIVGDNTCASQSQFCDTETSTCVDCPAGTFNCDRLGGTCECSTACDGNSCKQECTFAGGCGDTSQQCDFGTCVPCPAGRFNCDNTGGCECDSAGCDGDKCVGVRSCDYLDADNPCGSNEMWCYQNECKPCSEGFYNCNGTKGCECDSAGCAGHDCAGSCTGGECP